MMQLCSFHGIRRVLARYAWEPLETWVCAAGIIGALEVVYSADKEFASLPLAAYGAWAAVWAALYVVGAVLSLVGIGTSMANLYAAGLILFAAGVSLTLVASFAVAHHYDLALIVIRLGVITAFFTKAALLIAASRRLAKEA